MAVVVDDRDVRAQLQQQPRELSYHIIMYEHYNHNTKISVLCCYNKMFTIVIHKYCHYYNVIAIIQQQPREREPGVIETLDLGYRKGV